MAWFVKASVFHSVNSAPSGNGGSNPAWVWYIDRSEVDTLCRNCVGTEGTTRMEWSFHREPSSRSKEESEIKRNKKKHGVNKKIVSYYVKNSELKSN